MKRILAILLAIAVFLSLVACGSTGSAAQTIADAAQPSRAESETESSVEASAEVPSGLPEETPVESPAEAPAEETKQYYFEDGVLVSEDVRIEITDVKVIRPGESGNEYGDKPVIAFWYDTTNLTGNESVNAMTAWIVMFQAFQDTDPNFVNELQVAALPDEAFLETQSATIKEGGTVSNAMAYSLDSETVPVVLKATRGILGEDLGEMTFDLTELTGQSDAVEAEPSPTLDDTANELRLKTAVLPALKDTLQEFYGDNYEVLCGPNADGEKCILASVWKDGALIEATFAASDILDYKDQWDETAQTLKDFSLGVRQLLDDSGLSDYSFIIELLNDSDQTGTLLRIEDGTVAFNVVDKLASSE